MSFKFLLTPYVAYMLLSKDFKYFPALVLHFIAGSTMSYFILEVILRTLIKSLILALWILKLHLASVIKNQII